MGFLSSLVGAVAGPLVGGIFGSSSAKRERRNAIEDLRESLPRLRESAEKAGFNPLTALMANGGGGFANLPSGVAPLASIQAVTEGVTGVADILTGKKAKDDNRQQVIDDLNKLQLERAKSGNAGFVVKNTLERTRPTATMPVSGGTPRLGRQSVEKPNITVRDAVFTDEPAVPMPVSQVRPQTRPGLWSDGAVPVIGPDGGNMQISRKHADRLKLEPWDAFIVEDYEALLGDEGGQVVALPKIPGAVVQVEGGITKQRTAEQREDIAENPFDPSRYFGDGPTEKKARKKEREDLRKSKDREDFMRKNYPTPFD